jgi:L-cysteine/cystine lyase
MLYVSPAFRDELRVIAPSYMSFSDASKGLDSPLRETAQRFDTPSLAREAVAFSGASLGVLEDVGLAAVHARGAELARTLVGMLTERGRIVAPRGDTTLVAWEEDEPAAARARLSDAGVVVRDLPGRPYLRASVGAWNDESDLERLVSAL